MNCTGTFQSVSFKPHHFQEADHSIFLGWSFPDCLENLVLPDIVILISKTFHCTYFLLQSKQAQAGVFLKTECYVGFVLKNLSWIYVSYEHFHDSTFAQVNLGAV